VLFPPFCKLTPTAQRFVFCFGTIVSQVNLSIHTTHQFQSFDDLRQRKNHMHQQILQMVLSDLEQELHWDLEHSRITCKRKRDHSLVINKILEQCQEHLRKKCDVNDIECLDDATFLWLFEQIMGVKAMGREKFSLWLETGEAEILDVGLLEWKREWSKSKRKQLSLLKGEECASVALDLCKSLGLLRHEVEEQNELGETPLLAAAACGERCVGSVALHHRQLSRSSLLDHVVFSLEHGILCLSLQ
jgi:hypothetical protein